MVYRYGEWKLHEIDVDFKHIGKRKMYFFSKSIPKRGIPCEMPDGYEVGVNERTSLPYLKYKNKISLHQRRKQMRK